MNTNLPTETIARRLREWQNFLTTGAESHTSTATTLEQFENDYCPDMLVRAALASGQWHLRGLAERVEVLAAKWHERSDASPRPLTAAELETLLYD